MKKITLLMLLLSTLFGYSQVKRYSFAKSAGTYVEITDGTVVGNETSDMQRYVDAAGTSGLTGAGIPIGFNFTFNGYVYDRFAIATDGWISLGSSTYGTAGVNVTAPTPSAPLQTTYSAMPEPLSAKIAALGKDLMAQTGSSIRYKTIGVIEGQRVLVVQWKKFKKGAVAGTGDDFNFQIRLNETANTVDIVYGTMTSNASVTAQTYQVGLRAEPAGNPINFSNRNSLTGWNNTVDGTSAADAVLMNDLVFPSSGLTFTWTPPTCGVTNNLNVTSIGTNGATLNWGAYTPTPNSFEYIVSTSGTTPLSTDSGTTTTTLPVVLNTLNPTTVYNVYLRTKCGSEFTPWILGGTFKTLCLDALTFYEDFDSYTASVSTLPDCWSKAGTGAASAYIYAYGVTPMSGPNRLQMFGNNTAVSYAIMPVVSNLGAGTNRLKFKAYASIDHATFDVGYFTDITNTSTFKVLQQIDLPGTTIDKTQEFIVTFDAISAPGVKNLVFRNSGSGSTYLYVYVDNVVWEPNSTCPDITALAGTAIISTSINLSWTNGGSEKAWQYVYGPATIQNPDSLTPVETSLKAKTVSGLASSTKYKIWVRSKCDTNDLGAWVGPVAFSTTCSSVSQFMENFDASNSVMPSCWAKVGSGGYVYPTSTTGGNPNVLYLQGSSSVGIAMVSLPPVSNAGAGTHRLRFKMRVNIANSKMDVGYLTDVTDPASFQLLETVTCSNVNGFDSFIKSYGEDPKSPNLAFRNPGVPSSSLFIDDVAWEPIPTCPDVSAIATTVVTSVSAGLTWKAGGSENAWQYAVGSVTTASPFSLTPVDVTSSSTPLSVTINGLTPATTYRVWMRSKCTGNNYGAWMGPVLFTTTCASITSFSQNFDAGTTMPSCWNQVGITGLVKVDNSAGAPSGTNSLYLGTNSSSPAICAMPPVSNAGAGTYRLRFKYKSQYVGSVLEVGFLVNPSDTSTFSSLKSYQATQVTAFEAQTAVLDMDPTTDVLAFRNAGNSTVLYIDDVIWEPIPTCLDVKNMAVTGVTGASIGLDWDAGGSETNWQYVIGSLSQLDPSVLTPVDVSTISAVTINGLNASTSYKIWVRSKCSSTSIGDWSSPITVTTLCAGVNSFTQNFDASLYLPSCWNKVGSAGYGAPYNITGAPSGSTVLNLYASSGTAQPVVSMPPLSNAASGDHVLKFKYRTETVGCVLEVGYLTNPIDPTSFTAFSTITTDNTDVFKLSAVALGSSPLSNVIAFRNSGAVKGVIYVDDVSWEFGPTAVPACATTVTAVPNVNCGNYATTISWTAVAGADGYKLTIGTTSGGFNILNAFDTNLLSYSLVAPANTTYYYKVVPYNNFGPAIGCAEKTFVTSPNKCYCPSLPTGHDGVGIVNVTLGATNFVGSNKNYYDFSANPVNVVKGLNVNMPISFSTNGHQYKVAVYVDLNDNYIFESSEVFYSGVLGTGIPNIVDASFTMPATASLGIHGMRICSVDNSYTIDPCLSAGLGITADFKVNVVEQDSVLDNDPFDAVNFSYYPNPVTDVLNLSFNQQINNVSVVNLLGQEVVSKSVNANQGKIDMSHLSVGTYLVRITVGDQLKTIKVIKE